MDDFAQIVRLRERRLDRARGRHMETNRAFAAAGRRLTVAQNVVDDFLEETRTLELDLLTELLNTSVTTQDLMRIEETLKRTEQRAQKLADDVSEAKVVLNETGKIAEAAAADKDRIEARLNKSREMHDHMQRREQLVIQAAEDAELDEFSVCMTARSVVL
jgi:ATP phosphoribosyltransferase regulatory subunit HisZ